MSEEENGIALEYRLDEPPQKVWRAISIPEFRAHWLPGDALAEPQATSFTPGEEIRYRMRDNDPPFLESTVTFKISPDDAGGTLLRIIHQLDDVRMPANSNQAPMMLAA